jgi:hypothetical protein
MQRRFGRFGDTPLPPGMAPSGAPIPASVMMPSSLPQSGANDFFDPQADGSDIIFYVTNVQGLASTAPNGNTTIQIDSGIDFYWFASTYQADISGAIQQESTSVVPLVTVLINDTGSRKNLMNSAVPVTSIAGPGERPYRLVRPRLFRASSTINFTWTSYVASGTTYSNLYFVMHGYTKPRGT